ncbi:MAG TPA: TetR family transcriptional regulator [Burkholderiales bacterium]|nr:TetR family transcriptional regulator [Burkholderiales bacterium]
MARRTKVEAQETRNRILDTAEEVFRGQGVTSTSLADIADAAGVTRGAIYWHFRNKGDLFAAMLDRVALPMEEMIRRAADASTTDPLSSLRACCVHVLRHTAEDLRCRRVFEILLRKCEYVEELDNLSQRILQCRAAGLEMMERALRNAVHRGQLPPQVNARRAALGLHAYVDGLIYDWLLDPGAFALGREAEALVDQYLDGLSAASASYPAAAPRSTPKPASATASSLGALPKVKTGRPALAKPQR